MLINADERRLKSKKKSLFCLKSTQIRFDPRPIEVYLFKNKIKDLSDADERG
jgi:hypothetical protein